MGWVKKSFPNFDQEPHAAGFRRNDRLAGAGLAGRERRAFARFPWRDRRVRGRFARARRRAGVSGLGARFPDDGRCLGGGVLRGAGAGLRCADDGARGPARRHAGELDMSRADAVLFDKDGTLFDFHATWSVWAHGVIVDLAGGAPELMARLADAAHYDLGARRFRPSSPIVAGTNREAAECFASVLPDHRVEEIEVHLMRRAATAPLAPAVPLAPYLEGLGARGLRLGVVTNDTE